MVSIAVPPTGCHGSVVRLLPLPSVHEPHARRDALPPPAAARHARDMGQPEHRSVPIMFTISYYQTDYTTAFLNWNFMKLFKKVDYGKDEYFELAHKNLFRCNFIVKSMQNLIKT